MSEEGIPPDPYDSIDEKKWLRRTNGNTTGTPDKNTSPSNQLVNRPAGSHQIPTSRGPLPKESTSKIRAWSLWIIIAAILGVLLIVALDLVEFA